MSAALLRESLLENEERKADTCETCSGPADEEYEPYCRHCGDYWRDVEEGLFEDVEAELAAITEVQDNE